MIPQNGYLVDFEDACARRGVKPEEVIMALSVMSRFMKNALGYVKLMFMTETANLETHGVELPSYLPGEEHYSNWVWIKADKKRPAGFGFGYTFTITCNTHTLAGVRLDFMDRGYAAFALANWKECKEFYLPNVE